MTTLVGLAFVAVLAGILGVYWLFVLKPEHQTADVLQRRLKGTSEPAKRKTSKLLRHEHDVKPGDAVSNVLGRASGLSRKLSDLCEQSGVKVTVGGLLAVAFIGATVAFSVGWVAFRMVVVGLLLAPIAFAIPFIFLNFKRQRRISMFEEQFPEALDLLARSLRAGHALTTGIALVAEEMLEPVGPEFRLLYDRQNFGMPFPDALRDFGERIPVLDAKFFTTAVLIQREAGGNLSEVLGNLSSVIRERFRVKRQVRVLSAHGRITGWVLSGLPPALAGAFMITSPNHMQTLIDSPLGRQMIVFALLLQLIGTMIIRKLVNIEY
jgi:tight adherence protein B